MLIPLEPADGEAILPLDLLKMRVRVLSDDEDSDIERMRAQAIDFVERYSGKALQRRSFQWITDRFCARIALPIGPVESVDAISYYDSLGVDTALAGTEWYLGNGVVQAAVGTAWPVSSGQTGSVRISFTAGYESAALEAPALLAAVELLVGHFFNVREAVNVGNIVTEMPFGVAALCDGYRSPGI